MELGFIALILGYLLGRKHATILYCLLKKRFKKAKNG